MTYDEAGAISVASIINVARHEAGHVAAYYHFEKMFQSVSIVPAADSKGRCTPFPQDRPEEWTELLLTEWMIIACCGVAAESLWQAEGEAVKDWLNQTDVQPLWHLYSHLCGVDASIPWAGACWQEAERMMREYRDWVERIAALLLDKGTVSGSEAVGVI